jgi:hypothetical protein
LCLGLEDAADGNPKTSELVASFFLRAEVTGVKRLSGSFALLQLRTWSWCVSSDLGPLNGGLLFDDDLRPVSACSENLQNVMAITEFLAGSDTLNSAGEKGTRP